MKRSRIALRIIALALLIAITSSLFIITPLAAGEYDISPQDSILFATGLDASKNESFYDLNKKSYQIFDFENEDFKNIFKSRKAHLQESFSITGSSQAEFAANYEQNRSTQINTGISAPVSVASVSANIEGQFATSIANSLTTINEEYYEYYEYYKRTRTVTAYWEEHDLTNFFRTSFLNDYNSIDNRQEAQAFLEKYGTHLFHTYHMGGSLVITKYVVSEGSIAEVYEQNKKSLSLSTSIEIASVKANASGGDSDASISSENVNTATTKSKNIMKGYGGKSLNALTVDTLFRYNQEYAAGKESGYVFKHWMESLDEGTNECLLNATEPIAIWELMGEKYGDVETNYFLEEAYEMMCFENYSQFCQEKKINSDLIGNISYNTSDIDVSFTISDDTIYLPPNTTAILTYGENITKNNCEDITTFELVNATNIATLVDGNKINISPNASGRAFKLNILMGNNVIQSLKVVVERGSYSFAAGYGTKDQPYVISTAEHWKALSDMCTVKNKYYILANDIDLEGELLEPIAVRTGETFNGHIDGNSKTLSNFTVMPKSSTICENIGIITVNNGSIENLSIANVKVLTNTLQITDNLNAGILTGKNYGKIDNVFISDSAVRASTNMKAIEEGSPILNVGAACGYTAANSTLTNVGVLNCNMYGLSFDKGTINVGGIVGTISGADVSNCYIYDSNANIYNRYGDDEMLGTIAGLVAENTSTNDNKTISTSTLANCVSNSVTLNVEANNYGYVAGSADPSSVFRTCYYGEKSEKSVAKAPKSGCTLVTKALTLKNTFVNDPNWITIDGKIVLAAHTDYFD